MAPGDFKTLQPNRQRILLKAALADDWGQIAGVLSRAGKAAAPHILRYLHGKFKNSNFGGKVNKYLGGILNDYNEEAPYN